MVESGDTDKNGKRATGGGMDPGDSGGGAPATDWSAPAFVWPETATPTADVRPAGTAPREASAELSRAGPGSGAGRQPGLDGSFWYEAGDPALRLLRDYHVPASRDTLLAGAIVTLSGICDKGLEVLRYDLSDTKISASLADLPTVGFAVLNFHGEDTAESYRRVLNTVRYLNRKPNATAGNRSITFEVVDAGNRLIDVRTVAVHLGGGPSEPGPPPADGPAEPSADAPAASAPKIQPAEPAIVAPVAPAPEPAAAAGHIAAEAAPAPATDQDHGVFAAVSGYRIFEPRGAIIGPPRGTWGAEYLFKNNMMWIKGRGAYVLFTDHIPQGRLIGPPMVRPWLGDRAVSGEMLVVLPVGAEVTIGRTRTRRNGPPPGRRIH